MIDASDLELRKDHTAQQCEHNRRQNGRPSREQTRELCNADIEQALQQERETNTRRPLGCVGGHEKFKGFDHERERRIDKSRPMHEDAMRRIEPRDREVEPVLSRKKIADFDKLHRIVGIRERAVLPHAEEIGR